MTIMLVYQRVTTLQTSCNLQILTFLWWSQRDKSPPTSTEMVGINSPKFEEWLKMIHTLSTSAQMEVQTQPEKKNKETKKTSKNHGFLCVLPCFILVPATESKAAGHWGWPTSVGGGHWIYNIRWRSQSPDAMACIPSWAWSRVEWFSFTGANRGDLEGGNDTFPAARVMVPPLWKIPCTCNIWKVPRTSKGFPNAAGFFEFLNHEDLSPA